MVWALAILCTSLSCEPIPIVSGWFDSAEDCAAAAGLIMASWKPDIGFYVLACFERTVI